MKARTYYTLAICCDGKWYPEFGDFDRRTVNYEMTDMRDHGTRRKDMRIVQSGPHQKDIMDALAAMNGRTQQEIVL